MFICFSFEAVMRMEKSIKYEDKLVKVEELLNEVIRVAYFIFTFLVACYTYSFIL